MSIPRQYPRVFLALLLALVLLAAGSFTFLEPYLRR